MGTKTSLKILTKTKLLHILLMRCCVGALAKNVVDDLSHFAVFCGFLQIDITISWQYVVQPYFQLF